MMIFYIFLSILVLAALGAVGWGIHECWSKIRLWLKIVLCTLAAGQLFFTVMFFISLAKEMATL